MVKLASQMMKESRHSATLAGSSFDCISSSPRSLGNSVRNSKTAHDALSMKNICNKLGPENNMTLKILFVLFSLFNFLYLWKYYLYFSVFLIFCISPSLTSQQNNFHHPPPPPPQKLLHLFQFYMYHVLQGYNSEKVCQRKRDHYTEDYKNLTQLQTQRLQQDETYLILVRRYLWHGSLAEAKGGTWFWTCWTGTWSWSHASLCSSTRSLSPDHGKQTKIILCSSAPSLSPDHGKQTKSLFVRPRDLYDLIMENKPKSFSVHLLHLYHLIMENKPNHSLFVRVIFMTWSRKTNPNRSLFIHSIFITWSCKTNTNHSLFIHFIFITWSQKTNQKQTGSCLALHNCWLEQPSYRDCHGQDPGILPILAMVSSPLWPDTAMAKTLASFQSWLSSPLWHGQDPGIPPILAIFTSVTRHCHGQDPGILQSRLSSPLWPETVMTKTLASFQSWLFSPLWPETAMAKTLASFILAIFILLTMSFVLLSYLKHTTPPQCQRFQNVELW